MSKRWKRLAASLALSLLLSACTSARISSAPAGADVMISVHRGILGQSDWETRCKTPCSITLQQSLNKIRVRWPDGTLSDIRSADIDFFLFETFDFHFVK